MKTKVPTFYRDLEGHYILNGKRVGLQAIRKLIKREKPFKVISTRTGSDITHVAAARALAYRYIDERKRSVATQFKKSAKVLTS